MKRIALLPLILFSFVYCKLSAQSGYSGRLDLGFGSDYDFRIYTAHGKFVKPNLFIGLGTGLTTPLFPYKEAGTNKGDVLIFPLVLEAQYIPFKTRVSPFVSAQIGAENTLTTTWSKPYGSPVELNYKLVGIVSPSIGLRLRLINKLALSFKFSAHIRTSSTYNISQQALSYALGIEF